MPRKLPVTLAEKEALNLMEASAVFMEDIESLRKLLRAGAIPYHFTGHQYSILRADLLDYFRGRNAAETAARKRQTRRAAA